jgi:hypothetical protein
MVAEVATAEFFGHLGTVTCRHTVDGLESDFLGGTFSGKKRAESKTYFCFDAQERTRTACLARSPYRTNLRLSRIAAKRLILRSVAEKPMFRESFERRRCLIPASGYYEWKNMPDGKQPYYFTRRDGEPLTLAGLWDQWHEKPVGAVIKSCTMVITGPNEFVGDIHDRMPVIVEPQDFERWEKGDMRDAAALMKPDSTLTVRMPRRKSSARIRTLPGTRDDHWRDTKPQEWSAMPPVQ